MKLSKFNIELEENENFIVYNSLTNGVLRLNKQYTDIYISRDFLSNCSTKEACDLTNELQKGGMIVEEDLDEIEKLKVIRRLSQYNSSNLSLTIAPTTNCNFVCPYCYEKGVAYHNMNKDVIEKTIAFIKENLKEKSGLSICWYGGEPLLSIDTIDEITRQIKSYCDDNKITYSAAMITNGYLLNEATRKKVRELFINYIQVTIDGDKSSHDSRRILKNGNPTYDTILDNVKKLDDSIKVSIRVNIDQDNSHIIDKLAEMMETANFGNNVSLYIAPVDNINDTCTSKCIDISAFSQLEINLLEKLTNKMDSKISMPHMSLGVCGANSINSFVIGPEGELYKCWNHIGHSKYVVGYVDKVNKLNNVVCSFMLDEPADDKECSDCPLLPVCYGGCTDSRIKLGFSKCQAAKFNVKNRLELLSIINSKSIM